MRGGIEVMETEGWFADILEKKIWKIYLSYVLIRGATDSIF